MQLPSPAAQALQDINIEIRTISGERVSAPIIKWIQALILDRSPDDLVRLMRLVEPARVTLTDPHAPTSVPDDPDKYLNKDDTAARRH